MPQPIRSIFGSGTAIPSATQWEHSNRDQRDHPDSPSEATTPGTRPSPLQLRAAAAWTQNQRLDFGASHLGAGGGTGVSTTGAIAGALKTPPTVYAGRKRPPLPATHSSTPTSEPLHKRRRLQRPNRHSLDHFNFSTGAHFQANGPPSPLFFSRSVRPRLPARFSSSEAAAKMLSKTHGEDGGIKIVNLPRGTFSGLSPPAPMSGTSGRSSERSSLAPLTASPDARERGERDPLRLLSSIGIVELLEQDTRPTFIVDIGHLANYTPESSSLQILFANTALRSSAGTWELVAGKPTELDVEDSIANATIQFRNWLLSTVIQGESPNINPSPVEHGGVIWSCYTLRKRLRVVSGAVPTHAAAGITPANGPSEFAIPSTSSAGAIVANLFQTSPYSARHSEPQDYFGDNVATSADTEVSAASSQLIRTGANSPRDVSGIFQTAPKSNPQSVEHPPSFFNECALRAQSAGDTDAFLRDQDPSADHDMGFFDWTRLSLSNTLPRHIQFARSVDWANTPLGPIEYWSNDLRAMCNLIM